MSEKLTRIRLPGQSAFKGLLDWGAVSAPAMISLARLYAKDLREQAEAIEAAGDDDFQIDEVRGAYVQHHLREIQKSAREAA